MGGSYLGIFVEATVSFLLLVTIGYCLVINRKLENLRSDKSELREIIFSLTKATSQAEQAIGNLRGTAGAIEEGLNERLAEARALESNLAENVEKGSALLAKLSALTGARAPSRSGAADMARERAAARGQRPAAPRSAAEAAERPANGVRLRHSEVGLGLLNAEERTGARNSGRNVA